MGGQERVGGRVHYGLVIAVMGALTVMSCLGLGRFALGMLLPGMGISLSLSYSQMGLIGTGNFVGYLVAVMIANGIAARMGARATIAFGIALVGVSMVLVGGAGSFVPVMLLYVVTGLGAGLANVPMMGLVSHWYHRSARGRAAGVMVSANGVAIVLSGLLIPLANAAFDEGWRVAWWVMGGFVLAAAAVAGLLLRNSPAEMGLEPMGRADPPKAEPTPGTPAPKPRSDRATMIHLGLIYAMYGAAYVVYATFIVTTLVDERGMGEDAAGLFWAWVGALSIASGPLFGWISDHLGRKATLIGIYALFGVSYALVAAGLPGMGLYASIAIFGLCVWSIPSIMAAAVGDYLGPLQAVKAFGFVTLFFGMGQVAGPAMAGVLADMTGSFGAAYWMCAGLAAAGMLLTAVLQKP